MCSILIIMCSALCSPRQ